MTGLRWAAGTVLVLAVATGCAGGSSAASTSTPPTASTSSATAAATTTPPPKPPAAPPVSADKGRTYEFGTIISHKTTAGVVVLTVDRWSANGVDDAALAVNGLPIGPWASGNSPYKNVNKKLTYAVPVAADAKFIRNSCSATAGLMDSSIVPITDFLALKTGQNIVLLSLDNRGYVTVAANLPGC